MKQLPQVNEHNLFLLLLGLLIDKSMWSASASSIGYQKSPDLAIDNDVNEQQVFFHSFDGDVLPWFQVELEDSYTVLQVDVYNRRDSDNEAVFTDFENLEVHLFLIFCSFTYWNIFNISGEGGRHRRHEPGDGQEPRRRPLVRPAVPAVPHLLRGRPCEWKKDSIY